MTDAPQIRELAENTMRLDNPNAWKAMRDHIRRGGHTKREQADLLRSAWEFRKALQQQKRAAPHP